MKRWWIQAFIAVVLAFVATSVLRVAVGWAFGASPYLQYMRWKHDDIPRLTIPVQLTKGEPVTFQARIIRARKYELNLLVYFTSKEQRTEAERLIGRRYAPLNYVGEPLSVLPTAFRITVQDQGRVLSDQVIRSDGVLLTGSKYLGRGLALLSLETGIYSITITPQNEVSPLKSVRIELAVC